MIIIYNNKSGNHFKLALILVVVIVAGSLAINYFGSSNDRSYHFTSVIINAAIMTDGTMQVTEERTFKFDGAYRGAWQFIDIKNKQHIKDISVAESDFSYEEMPPGSVDVPGTYFIESDWDQIYIDWSFEAVNEERTFLISYTVENAVLVHQDTAELYWQFIGDEWAEPTDYALVTLTLPEKVETDNLQAWGHGPLHGRVEVPSSDTVTWEVNDLPGRTFLEGRLVFPTSIVPGSTNFSEREALTDIIAEQEAFARQANFEQLFYWIFFLVAPLPLIITAIYHFHLKKKLASFPDTYRGQYYRELPADYSPAVAGYLMRNGSTAVADFTATTLDLARRGHLEITEDYPVQAETGQKKNSSSEYKIIPIASEESMLPHEQKLYSFIFDQVGKGDRKGTSLESINSYAKENTGETSDFFKRWRRIVKKEAGKYDFFKEGYPALLTLVNILAILSSSLFLYWISVIAGMQITEGTMFVVGLFIIIFFYPAYYIYKQRHITTTGAEHYSKWNAFKRFLNDFSNLEEATLLAYRIWEHYLVYAVSLGVAGNVIRQLKLLYPEVKESDSLWLVSRTRTKEQEPLPERFNRISDSIHSSLTDAYRTATSSPARSGSDLSSGGGFSAGGGGGGGGGGGAR